MEENKFVTPEQRDMIAEMLWKRAATRVFVTPEGHDS